MGNFKLKIFLAAALILLGFESNECIAQEVPVIEKLSEVNGSFDKINEIQQDSLGNLWIASDFHVQRYNAFFSSFYTQFEGLPENAGEINTLFIDSKNNIWVGTENGIFKYLLKKDLFVEIPSERSNTKTNVQKITEDSAGKIWIGSNSGIWNITKDQLVLVSSFPSKQTVNKIISTENSLLFGTSKGLFTLNKHSGQYKKIPLLDYQDFSVESILFTGEFYFVGTHEKGLYKTDANFTNTQKIGSIPYTAVNLPITDLAMDASGNLYIASNGDGLLILNKNLKLASHYHQEENNSLSLSDNGLNGLFLDKYNTLWVSTETGQINSINLRQNNFEFLRHDPKKYSSLADNFTTAIEEDSNGNIWFGTRLGLSVWNKKNDSWQHVKNLSYKYQSKVPDIIRDLQKDGEHMWIATFNDGIYKININTFLRAQYSPDASNKTGLQKVNTLLIDTKKNVWAGGEDGNLTQIKTNGEIKSYTLRGISAMLQLSTGDIIAAGKNGVFNIQSGEAVFQSISKLAPNNKNLPYFNITAISETLAGEIVFATEGAGIVLYDPENGEVKVIGEKQGLPSNRIQGLIVYGRNEIWAGTSKGLVNFKIEDELNIRVFDKEDGLLSAVFTRGSFAQFDNKLAFGTLKGVSVFNPGKLKSKKETTPNILFGSIDILSKERNTTALVNAVNTKKQLDLESDENSFNVKFYAMLPGNEAKLSYSWKLEGLDNKWTEPSSQMEANYANLAPGNYKFMVKAKKAYGKWSPVKIIEINIKAPWWSSTIAYLIYGLLLALFIAIPLYFFSVYRKRQAKKASSQFYSNLSQEIGTPLNILITSLSNIAEDEGTKNKHRLKNNIDRLRVILDPLLNFKAVKFSKKNLNPIISKISLSSYFEELKKDFSPLLLQKNLELIVNNQWNKEFFYYDAEYLNKIFFNLISNAIKYSFEDGKIIINLVGTNKGDLKIQIADNGLGLPINDQKIIKDYYKSFRSGSANQHSEQIELLYVKDFIDKLGGTIVFESSKNQGTTFTLVLKNHLKEKELDKTYIEKEKLPIESFRKPLLKVVRASEEKITIKSDIDKPLQKPVEIKAEITSEEIRILIAEDNDELRKVFVQSFKKLGEVFEAKNGVEAYELASRIIPNAIVADYNMSGMDGLDLYAAVRDNEDLEKTQIYLMTSQKDQLQIPENVNSGALSLIEKPVNLELLLQKIAERLDLSISLPFVNTNLSTRNSEILSGGLEDKFLDNLEKLVVQNIQNSAFTVEDLSEAIGVSSNSLYLRLKRLIGLTPLDFIIKTKLNYARTLIKAGESDLSEVARKAGFQNKDIFFSSFKKHFGFMPGTIIEKNNME